MSLNVPKVSASNSLPNYLPLSSHNPSNNEISLCSPSNVSPYLSIIYPENYHSFQISPTPQNSSLDHQLPSFHCDSNTFHFTTPSIHPPTTNISSPPLNIPASALNIPSSTPSILSPTLNHKPPIMDTTNDNDLVYLSL